MYVLICILYVRTYIHNIWASLTKPETSISTRLRGNHEILTLYTHKLTILSECCIENMNHIYTHTYVIHYACTYVCEYLWFYTFPQCLLMHVRTYVHIYIRMYYVHIYIRMYLIYSIAHTNMCLTHTLRIFVHTYMKHIHSYVCMYVFHLLKGYGVHSYCTAYICAVHMFLYAHTYIILCIYLRFLFTSFRHIFVCVTVIYTLLPAVFCNYIQCYR